MGSFVAEFQIPKISPFDEGHYTCGYQHLGVLSPASSSVRVTVLASLPAPGFKADFRAVLKGKAFKVICYHQYSPSRIVVFQNGKEKYHSDLPQYYTSVAINFHKITKDEEGDYTCKYRFNNIWSLPSVPIHLTVIDPKATLSVDPPHTTFAKGDEINMTCASSPPTTRFHLYKDQELWDSMEVPEGQNASTFLLDITGAEFRGNYSCRYNITVEGREISGLSSPSAQIKLIEQKKPEEK
nr:PREDICTED: immunoglobulin superfamily member 1-like [Latimeria chalumnae]|eukprot:XP_006000701.1 PREDICTED: immunoglobulin superfamily member 1-like [Latimeria chalumnae]